MSFGKRNKNVKEYFKQYSWYTHTQFKVKKAFSFTI